MSNVAPLFINRLGSKPVLISGLLLLTTGIALTALLPADGTFWNIVLSSVPVGAGVSVAFPALIIIAVTDVADTDQGLVSGLLMTGQQFGGALGLALVTFVAAVFTPQLSGAHPQPAAVHQALVAGFRPALLLAAAFALLGACIASAGIKGRSAAPSTDGKPESKA